MALSGNYAETLKSNGSYEPRTTSFGSNLARLLSISPKKLKAFHCGIIPPFPVANFAQTRPPLDPHWTLNRNMILGIGQPFVGTNYRIPYPNVAPHRPTGNENQLQ